MQVHYKDAEGRAATLTLLPEGGATVRKGVPADALTFPNPDQEVTISFSIRQRAEEYLAQRGYHFVRQELP